jgi:lysophospholipase L1-like esterase
MAASGVSMAASRVSTVKSVSMAASRVSTAASMVGTARRGALAGAALLALLLLARLAAVLWQGPHHRRYWRALAEQPVPPDAIRLVALGDSTMQAIGAVRPKDGLVGRAADHLTTLTGRPVHIVNASVGGATVADVVHDQLPNVDLAGSDVVLVSVSSSDISRRTPLPQYASAMAELVRALPAERTVLSDTPLQPRRGDYQEVLTRLADERGIARADFVAAFLDTNGPDRASRLRELVGRLGIFSGDFHHLNGRGYGYWFNAFRPGLEAIAARWRCPHLPSGYAGLAS